MSTSLHDRLADLADDAPPGGPVPDLWGRATRYHRRRRFGTVVIATAACLSLLAVAGLSWFQAKPDVQPAGGREGLPDRIYQPSKWLGEADAGRIAAAFSADRGSLLDTTLGVVGITASTGQYGFVDLPGLAGGWALSPSGQHIAFWRTGETSGRTNDDTGDVPVAAVAVYDTVTSELRSHPIETEHGLEQDALAWSDDQTIVLSYGQIVGGPDDPDMEQGMSTLPDWFVWDLRDAAPSPLDLPDAVDGAWLEWAGDGATVLSGDRAGEYWLLDPRDPESARRLPRSVSTAGEFSPVPERDGDRVAGVLGQKNPNQVVVADAAPQRARTASASPRPVPGTGGTFEVLAWPDEHLFVERQAGRSMTRSVLARVDPSSGEASTVVRLPEELSPRQIQYASDLFSEPTVEGVQPPTPIGPRTTVLLVLVTTSVAASALVWWRRRVRP